MPLPLYQPKNEQPLAGIKHMIGVAAGKGGVGKSTVTVNLALALQKLGYSVGILDADIYGPSLRKMLKGENLPTQTGEIIAPAIVSGIKMISMAYFRKAEEAAAVRAPIANAIITQFLKQVSWGSLDYLLIDFPPGTGDVQLTLCQQANLRGAIMVTTPQEVAVLDVRKAIHLFSQVQVPIIGVVENMSYYQPHPSEEKKYLFGKGGGERLARETGVPFLGMIPIDSDISQSGDQGVSLFNLKATHDAEASPAVQAFYTLARELVSQVELVKTDLIQKVFQKDLHSFTVVWSDGKTEDYQLRDLQRQCPCAGCVDEQTGNRVADPTSVKDDVKAVSIHGVGRYALRIAFSSGCSHGIYDFTMLRQMGRHTHIE
jgi:ATP-binding protein involved in chromosome partitioning